MNTRTQKSGFTVAEMVMALTIMALLLSAVALAMQAALASYGENTRIADVTQTSRIVLNRMMAEIRTADAVDSTSSRVDIIPPANGQGLTQITYELLNGVLYCKRTVNGTEESNILIDASGDVRIVGFDLSRETGLDDGGLTYTKSLTSRLELQAGENRFYVTASACPRRNMEY